MLNKYLETLLSLKGPSSAEEPVSDYITSVLEEHKIEYKIDDLGNVIAHKKGKNTPNKHLLVIAHMDEVGLIVTSATNDGFLKFAAIGGVDGLALAGKRVMIGDKLGIIGMKPIHLSKADERDKNVKIDDLYIDIGVFTKEDALKACPLGTTGTFCNEINQTKTSYISKSLDDRVGCAVLLNLLTIEQEYDFTAVFSVQEEVGLRGAKVSTFAVNPDVALVLETTTANDMPGVDESATVCDLGKGVAVSFMDRSTIYDKRFVKLAMDTASKKNIKAQYKRAVAGGNDSGAVHLTKEGVRTLALSVPARYLHSSNSVVNKDDITSLFELAKEMVNLMVV